MQQFTIPPQGIIAMKKKILRRTLPVIIVSATLPFFQLIRSDTFDYLIPLIVIPIMIVLIRFALIRALKKQIELLESYSLVIGENAIIRQQGDSYPVSILFADITAITKNKNGSFTVKSRFPRDVIQIPAHIGQYDLLEQSLKQLQALRQKPAPQY